MEGAKDMGRLRIVIADTDEGYVQGLSDYISSFHSARFEITTFTCFEFLREFLLRKEKSVELLLISPEMYSSGILAEQVSSVALLAPGSFTAEARGLRVINKYQHVEKIMSDIAQVFSESQTSQTFLAGGNRKAKVVGVYSPGGGTGKTTVALCCSIQSALRGQKVFYLNLESLPVIPDFFERNHQRSFSRALYYIKEKSSNLALKIDGVKCIDTRFGIHYFSPVEHPFDMEELTAEEAGMLVETLKSIGQYDFIFVDMSSGFNRLNSAIMGKCQQLLIVSDPQPVAKAKCDSLMQQLVKLPSDFDPGILNRAGFVVNKVDDPERAGEENVFKLPLLTGCKLHGIEACVEDEGFTGGIYRILEWLL